MKLISVVAASANNVIGIDNKMPWHLPDDLKFFKQTTSGFPIIMGKNTWLSLGQKPLPNRANVVISNSLEAAAGAIVVKDIEQAISLLETSHPGLEKAFVIGGGQIYKATMDIMDEMYVTRIHTVIDNGMVFFPEFAESDWEKVWSEFHDKDEKHLFSFTFEHWIRKNK
ncbi:MAG: hypothetical protein BGO31_09435 [Bacteroidetes bacterium 43-16]|nr:MAG: hypothetical protein BGO31_09435 [Bacteroidetes bacterium 43-16]